MRGLGIRTPASKTEVERDGFSQTIVEYRRPTLWDCLVPWIGTLLVCLVGALLLFTQNKTAWVLFPPLAIFAMATVFWITFYLWGWLPKED